MALRGFGGLQALPVTVVPVFGTTLSAAAVINPDQYTGLIAAGGSNKSSAVLSVANAGRFRDKDHVAIGTAAQFEQGNSVQADGGTVTAVSAAAGTITVQGLQRSHASGEFVVLAMPCAEFNIQVTSASNPVYLGEDPTVGLNSQTLIEELTAVGTFSFGTSNIGNVLDTQHLWLGGGTGVEFIPAFLTV